MTIMMMNYVLLVIIHWDYDHCWWWRPIIGNYWFTGSLGVLRDRWLKARWQLFSLQAYLTSSFGRLPSVPFDLYLKKLDWLPFGSSNRVTHAYLWWFDSWFILEFTGYYFLAETWFAVLFTVIVEIVNPEVIHHDAMMMMMTVVILLMTMRRMVMIPIHIIIVMAIWLALPWTDIFQNQLIVFYV